MNFETGVEVGFLVVHFNKTSAYLSEDQVKIRGICKQATETLGKLDPGFTRPLETGAWKPINVFVSRQLPDTEGGCDNSHLLGLAHMMGEIKSEKCADHPYKMESIQVRARGFMRDVYGTVLHELIHALHFRNDHTRRNESAYIEAEKGLYGFLEVYLDALKEKSAIQFQDRYASSDIYEFLVGVVLVLAGESADMPKLTEFVQQNEAKIKGHVFVILNADA
jgi:hypothetical protein